jgi:hypothetical protein
MGARRAVLDPADMQDTSTELLSGRRDRGPRGPAWGTKRRERIASNGPERHKNCRFFKGQVVIHLVRDEGVVGSNPITPTSNSPTKSETYLLGRVWQNPSLGQKWDRYHRFLSPQHHAVTTCPPMRAGPHPLSDRVPAASARSWASLGRKPSGVAAQGELNGDPTAYRLCLRRAGFDLLPLDGKRAPLEEWHRKIDSSDDEIRLSGQLYPDATDTGALIRLAPAIDIDILNPRQPKRSRSWPAIGSTSSGGYRV